MQNFIGANDLVAPRLQRALAILRRVILVRLGSHRLPLVVKLTIAIEAGVSFLSTTDDKNRTP
jgi:hypothetical protein